MLALPAIYCTSNPQLPTENACCVALRTTPLNAKSDLHDRPILLSGASRFSRVLSRVSLLVCRDAGLTHLLTRNSIWLAARFGSRACSMI